jgi:hypothetical protein
MPKEIVHLWPMAAREMEAFKRREWPVLVVADIRFRALARPARNRLLSQSPGPGAYSSLSQDLRISAWIE